MRARRRFVSAGLGAVGADRRGPSRAGALGAGGRHAVGARVTSAYRCRPLTRSTTTSSVGRVPSVGTRLISSSTLTGPQYPK